MDFPGGSVVKNPSVKAGDLGSIPGSGRSRGEGNDNPLQYSCLENPMDRGAWHAAVHGISRVGHYLVTKLTREVLIFLLILSQSFHTATIAPSIFPQFFS